MGGWTARVGWSAFWEEVWIWLRLREACLLGLGLSDILWGHPLVASFIYTALLICSFKDSTPPPERNASTALNAIIHPQQAL